MSQYRELQAFAQFGTDDLDATTKRQLERGARLTELLKQKQYSPKSLSQQVTILFAGTKGHLDDVPIEKVGDFEEKFEEFMQSQHKNILDDIEDSKDISEETEKKLEEAITSFKGTISY